MSLQVIIFFNLKVNEENQRVMVQVINVKKGTSFCQKHQDGLKVKLECSICHFQCSCLLACLRVGGFVCVCLIICSNFLYLYLTFQA